MKKEDAIEVNLSEWTLSGGGAQGSSYHHISDNSLILKLFEEKIPVGDVISEIEISRAVQAAGVTCPKPGQLVRHGDRYGIIFQRILNKKSFCRAIADDPSCLPDMARRLAKMALDLHSRPAVGTGFISLCDYFEGLLDKNTTVSEDMRGKMEKALETARTAETNTLAHGDFHFGNAITDGQTDYFIDLGAFGYGNPDWDNSTLWLIIDGKKEDIIMHMFHIDVKTSLDFWNVYKREYYGPDCPSEAELAKRYAPYCLLRTLFYERDLGASDFVLGIRERLAGMVD